MLGISVFVFTSLAKPIADHSGQRIIVFDVHVPYAVSIATRDQALAAMRAACARRAAPAPTQAPAAAHTSQDDNLFVGIGRSVAAGRSPVRAVAASAVCCAQRGTCWMRIGTLL